MDVIYFTKELEYLQQKYQDNTRENKHTNPEQPLKNGIYLIQELYNKLNAFQKEAAMKQQRIEELSEEIKILNTKMDDYLKQYSNMVRQSEEYQEKLLDQIKKQEEIIRKFKY